jgi:hypothetical protein
MEDKTRRKLNVCLFAMLGNDDLVNRWWESPNLAFENKTPNEVYEENEQQVIDYVLSYLQK